MIENEIKKLQTESKYVIKVQKRENKMSRLFVEIEQGMSNKKN